MPVIEYATVDRSFTPTVIADPDVVDDEGRSDAGKMFTAAAVVNDELNGVDASPSASAAVTATR